MWFLHYSALPLFYRLRVACPLSPLVGTYLVGKYECLSNWFHQMGSNLARTPKATKGPPSACGPAAETTAPMTKRTGIHQNQAAERLRMDWPNPVHYAYDRFLSGHLLHLPRHPHPETGALRVLAWPNPVDPIISLKPLELRPSNNNNNCGCGLLPPPPTPTSEDLKRLLQ